MSLIKANGAGDQDTGFYNGVATQSLRFDSASSAFLSKTPSASNLKTWTWCAWVKRTKLGVERAFWSVGASEVDFALFFGSDDTLRVWSTNGGASYYTERVFRDTNAWYHIAITSNNSTPFIRLYINGELNTTSSYDNRTSVPAGNNLSVNTNDVHRIGAWYNGSLQYFDGYLADINHIDGTAVGDTNGILDEFIEIKNGVCIPKRYTGSYGTNGYRLEFKQTGDGSSTAGDSTIGADTANNNDYNDNNMDAHDSNMPDSPENNFPTINILHRGASAYSSTTTSEGNLSFKHSNLAHASAIASMSLPKSGKWYWETLNNSSATNGTNTVGVVVSTYTNSTALSGSGSYFWQNGFGLYGNNGDSMGTAPSVTFDKSGSATTFTANDIIGVAYDADNKDVEWYKNGSKMDYNVTDFDDDGNDLIPASSAYGNPANSGIVFNFGQDSSFAGGKTSGSANAQDANGIGDFYYAPPTGFLALCSSNISDDTLPISPAQTTQAVDHFGTLTYTSDGNAVNIVSGANDNNGTAIGGEINFSPDWVWIKRRNAGNNHQLFDTNRGTNVLQSNETDDESDYSSYFAFLSSSNGFRLPASSANMNANGGTYVAWNWKANGGTTTTNDASATSVGNIDSVYQANTTSGFSIVLYTGNGTNNTDLGIAHGLGVTPKMVWVKNRSTAKSWQVYNSNLSADGTYGIKNLQLDTNGAEDAYSDYIKTTSSTTFTIRSDASDGVGRVNKNGDNYVAYCFAEVEGYSKIGSYTGNGSTDGTFVYTGFRPAYLLYKRSDSSGNWLIDDDVTQAFNPDSNYLVADTADAEGDTTTNTAGHVFDMYSNGFKMRNTNSARNADGGTFIYMAFARAPFKFANAR